MTKLSAAIAAVVCSVALNAGAARANTFDISGTIFNGNGDFIAPCPHCSLGGMIDIDATGHVTLPDVTVTGVGLGPFKTLVSVVLGTSSTDINLKDASQDALVLVLPVADLQNYSGGAICGISCPLSEGNSIITPVTGLPYYIDSGALTAAGAPGPIAGAGLPGLIAACGGLLALRHRRRRIA
jgi:hypothetical protein